MRNEFMNDLPITVPAKITALILAGVLVSNLSHAVAADTKDKPTTKSQHSEKASAAKTSLTSKIPKSSWASFRNDDEQRGIATSSLPEKLELLWKVPTQDGWVASVAIVGD